MTSAGVTHVLVLLAAISLGALLASCAGGEGAPGSAPAATSGIERVAWGGWPDAYRLSNGEAELVAVPAVSRILSYGFLGGSNLLWRNAQVAGRAPVAGEWTNYGGSKTWLWPQDDWPARTGSAWPPPTDLPGTIACSAEVRGGRTLLLTSPAISGYGVVLVREIRLEDSGTRVHVTSELRKIGDGDFALAAWTVTQMPADGALFARLMAGSRLPGGYRTHFGSFAAVREQGAGVLVIERRHDQAAKLGMDADMLAWQRGDVLLVERPSDATAAPAAFAPGDRAQVYSHPDGDRTLPPGVAYVELELTSPLASLHAGESVTLETSLEIVRLLPDERTPAAIAEKLRSI